MAQVQGSTVVAYIADADNETVEICVSYSREAGGYRWDAFIRGATSATPFTTQGAAIDDAIAYFNV